MADPSFDVVSKVDRQEVDNALNQAAKELSQRFDFRGTGTSIAWAGDEAISVESETEERAKAAVDSERRHPGRNRRDADAGRLRARLYRRCTLGRRVKRFRCSGWVR